MDARANGVHPRMGRPGTTAHHRLLLPPHRETRTVTPVRVSPAPAGQGARAGSGRRLREENVEDVTVEARRKVQVDVLDLGVLVQGLASYLAHDPALLVPAERHVGIDYVPVVQPHGSGLQS